MSVTSIIRLDVVHVRGKRGRQVPVLLTKIDIEAISALIKWRSKAGITQDNVFVYAAPTRNSKHFLRGNEVMRKVLSKIDNLQNPERIRSTELRKYCATVTQISDLSENELRWLADHMGHNLDVHRDFYRLKDSTIELTKVARVLCAIDEGNAANFSGKSLSDINVEGM